MHFLCIFCGKQNFSAWWSQRIVKRNVTPTSTMTSYNSLSHTFIVIYRPHNLFSEHFQWSNLKRENECVIFQVDGKFSMSLKIELLNISMRKTFLHDDEKWVEHLKRSRKSGFRNLQTKFSIIYVKTFREKLRFEYFTEFFMRKKKIEVAMRKLNGHLKQLFEHCIHPTNVVAWTTTKSSSTVERKQ